jgi:hypothetical protein
MGLGATLVDHGTRAQVRRPHSLVGRGTYWCGQPRPTRTNPNRQSLLQTITAGQTPWAGYPFKPQCPRRLA